MSWFLRSRKAMTAVAIVLTFAAGILAGLWNAPPNGIVVDGDVLRPGRYHVEYPFLGTDFAPTQVATFKKDNTQGPWKVLLVIHDWDVGRRLVAVDSDRVEWKSVGPEQMPTLKVSVKDGEKKFTYFQPVAKSPGARILK